MSGTTNAERRGHVLKAILHPYAMHHQKRFDTLMAKDRLQGPVGWSGLRGAIENGAKSTLLSAKQMGGLKRVVPHIDNTLGVMSGQSSVYFVKGKGNDRVIGAYLVVTAVDGKSKPVGAARWDGLNWFVSSTDGENFRDYVYAAGRVKAVRDKAEFRKQVVAAQEDPNWDADGDDLRGAADW
jgi:hypothetical protein